MEPDYQYQSVERPARVSQLPSQLSFFGTYQPPPARGSVVIIDPRG